MLISEISQKSVVSISAEANLRQAAILMNMKCVGSLVVVDENNHPIGIVTDRDIVIKGVISGDDLETKSIRSLMSKRLTTISDQAEVSEAISLMSRENVRRMITLDSGGAISGIISADDLLKILVSQMVELGEIYFTQQHKEISLTADLTEMA